jgi:pyridoxamine 5'-phosphate oxidase
MPISSEELQDTHLFEKAIWRLLARGAVDAKHAFRLCSIATVNEAGKPDTRTVVMRECDMTNKTLSFHTDIRSGKVAHLEKHPDVCMLFWDPKQSLQLRVYGQAVIHHLDETAILHAGKLPTSQQALFGYHAVPGSKKIPDHKDVFEEALVLQHFAWVTIEVGSIDALHLGRSGVHTRVRFDYSGRVLKGACYLQA